MKQPNLLLYGSTTCADTTRTRSFLDRRNIPYEFKDVDEFPEYNDYVANLNAGKRVLPTIRIDNETLVNPSESELEAAVGEAATARG